MSASRISSPSRAASAARAPEAESPKHSVWDARPQTIRKVRAGHGALWSVSYSWKLRVTDTVAIALAVALSAMLGMLGMGGDENAGSYLPTGLVLLVFWTLDLELCRTREAGAVGVAATEYKRVLHSTLRVFGAMAIFMIALHLDTVRAFFAVAFPVGAFSLLAGRWAWRRWLARQRIAGQCLTDVVILGGAEDVRYVIGQLKSNLSTGYNVTGVALTSLPKEMELLPPWHKIPVLSTIADIGRVVSVTGAQTVVVAGPLPGGPSAIRDLGWRLEDMATELVLASSLTNVAGPRIHFRPVEGLPLMRVELPQYSGGKHVVKRAMDLVFSTIALAVLLPVLLVLALIVKLDSKGPVFFLQDRVGRHGQPFRMVKFRSMDVDAEAKLAGLADQNQGNAVLFKMVNDPRITRCGRWMRKYSLDELPQFWNVLLGGMSMVGPRPPLKSEVAGYEKPTHRRLLIKPGITGLWQVNGRSNLAWDEAVRLDLYYVENWSLTGDFIILWRTFQVVLKPNGAY